MAVLVQHLVVRALLDGIISDVWKRVYQPGSGEVWRRLVARWDFAPGEKFVSTLVAL